MECEATAATLDLFAVWTGLAGVFWGTLAGAWLEGRRVRRQIAGPNRVQL